MSGWSVLIFTVIVIVLLFMFYLLVKYYQNYKQREWLILEQIQRLYNSPIFNPFFFPEIEKSEELYKYLDFCKNNLQISCHNFLNGCGHESISIVEGDVKVIQNIVNCLEWQCYNNIQNSSLTSVKLIK